MQNRPVVMKGGLYYVSSGVDKHGNPMPIPEGQKGFAVRLDALLDAGLNEMGRPLTNYERQRYGMEVTNEGDEQDG